MSEIQEFAKTTAKSVNDIKPLKNLKQLENVHLDLNSPRICRAMGNLGLTKENLKPTDIEVVDDITQLRYEHFQNRLMDTINKIIIERSKIKMSQYKELINKMNQENDKKKLEKKERRKMESVGISPTFITSTLNNNPSPAVSVL